MSNFGPAVALPGDRINISTDTYSEPYWQAAKEHRLTTCKCANCGYCRIPPTPYCPECQSHEIDWPTLPGTGTIFSYAICTKSPYQDVADFVYVPIVVDIDGTQGHGARLVCNFVGNADEVKIGMKVKVIWTSINDGWELPNFEKA
jgi:uncharacterized OB-fold protein